MPSRFRSNVKAWLPLSRYAAVLGLLASAGSCGFLRSVVPEPAPEPRPFNHQAHLERGLECAMCHETAESGVAAGMPKRETCMLCHEELDKQEGQPLEKKVAWFENDRGELAWSDFTRQHPDVVFSHKAHAEKKISCSACHAGMQKNTGLLPGLRQRMDSCRNCHAAYNPEKTTCATCHRVLREDVPPDDHRQLWTKLHGAASREGAAAATSNDCAMCHRKDACTTCHETRPPADHNEFWRLRAHGIAAGVDRTRCMTCHKSDGCVRCHENTPPVSHGAGWGTPGGLHCRGCHLPLQTSGSCFVCHRATPGHDASPAMPPWHNPAMNCRSCHSAALTHPDPGGACTACHR